VHEPAKLTQAVEMIITQYAQDALVEEYIDGREIHVALLGNREIEVLPAVEHDFGGGQTRLMTWEVKYMDAAALPRMCPAQVESSLATLLQDIAVALGRQPQVAPDDDL
ncbi:hypothetical protein EN807_33800, partial [Mesorhizobium sp. M5C.F.Ca.ET.164.01.1.1]